MADVGGAKPDVDFGSDAKEGFGPVSTTGGTVNFVSSGALGAGVVAGVRTGSGFGSGFVTGVGAGVTAATGSLLSLIHI